MVTPDKIVKNYIEDYSDEQNKLDEDKLRKWAVDVVYKLCDSALEQWQERVLVLPVTNYIAELPPDFKRLIEVAFQEAPVTPKGRWQATQYVYDNIKGNCDLEVNLKCPECDQSCENCDYYFVEVGVDKIWEQAHPEVFYQDDKFIKNASTVFTANSNYHPGFQIMQPSTNAFFNVYAPYCDSTTSIYKYKYSQRFNRLEFGFREGYVLLAYYGVPLNEFGEPSVSEIPEVYDAANAYLDEKLAWLDYKFLKSKENAVFYERTLAKKKEAMRVAKSKLTKFEIRTFWAQMLHFYLKRLGRDPFKSLLK